MTHKKQPILVLTQRLRPSAAYKRELEGLALPHQQVHLHTFQSYFVAWDENGVYVENPKTGVRLEDFAGVYLLGWRNDPQLGMVMGRYLTQKHIPFVGSYVLQLDPTSKLGEMYYLTQNNTPYLKGCYATRSVDVVAAYRWANKRIGLKFPLVVKATEASRGQDNFLVRGLDELRALKLKPSKHYMLQEFLPNSFDYRYLIIDKKVRFVMKRSRQSSDTHLNNTSTGATAEFIDLGQVPANTIVVAEAAAQTLNRTDIAGVDILIDEQTNQPYVLEVNRTPHITTGQGVSQKLPKLYEYLNQLVERS